MLTPATEALIEQSLLYPGGFLSPHATINDARMSESSSEPNLTRPSIIISCYRRVLRAT